MHFPNLERWSSPFSVSSSNRLSTESHLLPPSAWLMNLIPLSACTTTDLDLSMVRGPTSRGSPTPGAVATPASSHQTPAWGWSGLQRGEWREGEERARRLHGVGESRTVFLRSRGESLGFWAEDRGQHIENGGSGARLGWECEVGIQPFIWYTIKIERYKTKRGTIKSKVLV